jgi:hypothetical protein
VKNGDLWLMSTPWGQRGFFWQEWTHGGDRWHRVSVTAAECPRISAEFLQQEREALGSHWYEQEYSCQFVETGSGWFSAELVLQALDDCEELKF